MAQQTAVEWLQEKVKETYNKENRLPLAYILDLIKQAKAMEEQQIIDIYHDAYKNGRKDNGIHGIEYYNQTFKKQSMSQESIDNQSDDIEELAKDVLYTKYPHHPWKDTGYWIDMFKEGYNKAKEKYKYTDDSKAKTMTQQTAIEWLALRYHHRQGYLSLEDIAKAKEMEKEQISESFIMGSQCSIFPDEMPINEVAEQYYKETYGK